MLKENNYSSISIHANHGSFYNRSTFHEALGFDKHYSLYDMKDLDHTTYNYYSDSNLIKSDKVYDLIVRDEKFFTYITSFAAHLPYNNTNELCKYNPHNLKVDDNEELSCLRNLAIDTDEMIRLLIERLDKDNLLDDTVLVLTTDHYTYGYEDVDYIRNIKNITNDNLLQHVPFIIWNNNIEHKEINTIMDTADIVPTLLNMVDIDYNPNYYSGTDVFSKEHENFVYFSEEVFYDGNNIYDINTSTIETEYSKNLLTTIKNKIYLNNAFIISDYFKIK